MTAFGQMLRQSRDWAVDCPADSVTLQNGCRAEYGTLELRIQATDSLNGFTVYVEDPRLETTCVYEQPVQSTLESAKDDLVLKAREYLDRHGEAAPDDVQWRCS
jgi:hypothetical protein